MTEPARKPIDPSARQAAFQLGVLLAIELNRLALVVIAGETAAQHLPDARTVDTHARRVLGALDFPDDKDESFRETLNFGRTMAETIRGSTDATTRRSELAGAANFMTLGGTLAKAELEERHGPEAAHTMLLGETTVKVLSQIKAWGTLFGRSQEERLPEYFAPFQRDVVAARKGIREDSMVPIFLLEVEETPLKSPEDLGRLRENFRIVLKTYFPDFDPDCFDRIQLF